MIHWAVVDGDPKAVKRDLLLALRSQVPKEAVIDAWADVNAILDRYRHCLAVDPDDIKPIASDNRIWEFRVELAAYNVLLRVYEAEDDRLPMALVALHAHQKQIGADADDTKHLQDAEIFVAIKRCDLGQADLWGYFQPTDDH